MYTLLNNIWTRRQRTSDRQAWHQGSGLKAPKSPLDDADSSAQYELEQHAVMIHCCVRRTSTSICSLLTLSRNLLAHCADSVPDVVQLLDSTTNIIFQLDMELMYIPSHLPLKSNGVHLMKADCLCSARWRTMPVNRLKPYA